MLNRERTRIIEVLDDTPVGSVVTVWGWLRTGRCSKRVAFAQVNDGSCFESLQLVMDREKVHVERSDLNTGTCIKATGVVAESPGKGQNRELQVTDFTVTGPVDPDFPIQKKKTTLEHLREWPHFRIRTRTMLAVFNIRNALCRAIHDFFQERGFCYVHTPLITRSDCEGAGEMFRVTCLDPTSPDDRQSFSDDFFGRPAFLTVSGQLEGETFALGRGEIYTFGPTFRADPSETPRHAAEFWMVEPEMAFYDFDDLLELIEEFIKNITSRVRSNCQPEIDFLAESVEPGLKQRYDDIMDKEFARVSFTDAQSLLAEAKERFETRPDPEGDLGTEHERFLTDEVFKGPVFVTDYPASVKPFYMKVNEGGDTVAATDLLVSQVGELVGGSQREERLDVLESRATACGLDRKEYEWYLQTRRWGSAPHSGFGLGFDRMVIFLTGMKNIRDVLPFPRCKGQMY